MKLPQLIILFFVSFSSTFSQSEEYIFKQITVEDGLSQSTVTSIIQDEKGYLWFGTAQGLNKYDGYKFKVFTNDIFDSTSISDNGISSLYKDKKGSLWIGTILGGLNLYNRRNDSFIRIKLKSSNFVKPENSAEYYEYPIVFSRNNNETITAIAEDSKERMWIGTWGNGIYIIKKNGELIKHLYYRKDLQNGLSYNRITSIVIDGKNDIWIGTFGGGLNRLRSDFTGDIASIENNFIRYSANEESSSPLSDNKVISVFIDSKKNIWIGTFYGGLNLLTTDELNKSADITVFKKFLKSSSKTSLSNNCVMTIQEDTFRNLWIGTFGGGLNLFSEENNSFTHFYNDPLSENSLGDNDVLSLTVDKSGLLWVGSHLGKGISIISRKILKFNHLKKALMGGKGLNDNVIWCFYEDNSGLIWIGTYRGGLNAYDRKNKSFTFYKNSTINSNSISDNHLRSIKGDKEGRLWIGTYSQGLNLFNPTTKKFYRYLHNEKDENTIGSNQIQDIFIDDDGMVYLATFGGGLNYFDLNSYKEGSKIEFKKFINNPENSNSLSDNRVYKIYKTREGGLWIGTFGGGLNFFDKTSSRFKSYKNIPGDSFSLSSNRILTIFESRNGHLWIGTYGGGLNRFDRKSGKFFRYTAKNGLSSDVIYGILEDNKGNLWMSTDLGIFRYDIQTKKFDQYDLQDGIQSLEFSGGAYLKTKNGEIFFGGINGINHFYPDSIRNNPFIPPIVITSIFASNQQIKGELNEIKMPYNKNFLSFEFASLDYTNSVDNKYAYKLEGLEDEWKYTDANNRTANYTNLSPGTYIFKVKGTNNDGKWNEEGAFVTIIITPPFWTTWWFIMIISLIVLALIYYLSTLRFKNQLAIEKLKTKLSADLHDNIGSGLTEIAILSELAASKPVEESSKELRNISNLARRLVDNMSDIVWVVNPKRDSLHDLIVRLKDSYNDFLLSIGISFKTSNIEKLSGIKLPIDFKQNLFLILKEGINNAVKHSNCKHIYLDVSLRGDVIEFTLNDDGIGMNIENLEYGNGIRNMENRANLIGGKLKIKSTQGEGTTIRFIGRIGRMSKINFLIKNK
jgi:ligand-binding sensor domain-containing protein/two-component sensor histidine kinase